MVTCAVKSAQSQDERQGYRRASTSEGQGHCPNRIASHYKYRLRPTCGSFHPTPTLDNTRPFSVPPTLEMHHRHSHRQVHTPAHTPAPAYNQGYGGYGTPPPVHGGYGSPPPPPARGGGGYPGYAQQLPPQRGPPPGGDPELWHWFSAVDTDRSGSITVTELQSALVNGAFFSSSSRPLTIYSSSVCLRAGLIFILV